MPYKSEKQRKFMHVKHPGIAAKWDKEYGGKVSKSVWGVVHKATPDMSSLYVPGTTMRGASLKPVKKKKRRTTEV